MRQIQKGNECTALSTWRQNNATVSQNLMYGKGGFPGSAVLKALLAEQGYLCAYILKLVDEASAHIEHLKPQKMCREEDARREAMNQVLKREDVDWNNMVACFPAPNPKAPPGYGAVKKDKWWPANGIRGFVSPLNARCESRFHFELNGEMKPANATDTAAAETIKEIGLNDDRLQELRQRAFIEMGLHRKSERPLESPAMVRRLIAAWLHRDGNNKFKEFCVPLRAVALMHLAKLEGRSNKGAV